MPLHEVIPSIADNVAKGRSVHAQSGRDVAAGYMTIARVLSIYIRRQLAMFAAIAIVAVMLSSCSDGGDGGAEPAPEVKSVAVMRPPEEGTGMANAALVDLGAAGYVEEEFFFEGNATSYRVDNESLAGVWYAEPAESAPYRSRMVVRRPADPAAFSGVVVVEWFNETGGGDGDSDWTYMHEEFLREGHAWVGVTAQRVGVYGGGILGEQTLLSGLIEADPERYGTLIHPGDAYSYDIFTQAGAALLAPDGPSPLADLEPRYLIATGQSQSAYFLTSYLNAIHPLAEIYDGFLVHSRGGGAPDFEGGDFSSDATTGGVQIRTDLQAPVLIFETETDLTQLGYFSARQDDTAMVRTWEVAGTAHADAFVIEVSVGSGLDIGALLGCGAKINDGPQHEVIQAAFHHLVAWVTDGVSPPEAPRIAIDETADPPMIVRDMYGNAMGGIRTPLVDVPVATLSGEPAENDGNGNELCGLLGSTTPFDETTLATLYPTEPDYLDAFIASADATVARGFVLRPEADALVAEADARDIGN